MAKNRDKLGKQMILRIDEELHKQIKIEAAKTEKSMNLLVQEAILQYFKDNKAFN